MIDLPSKQILTGAALSLFLVGLALDPALAQHDLNHSEPATQQSGANPQLSQASRRSRTTQAQRAQRVAGIVHSVNDETLVLRLADGTCQTFTMTSQVLGNRALRKGTLVIVNTDTAQRVTRIETPAADETIAGVVSAIADDQVTVQLPNGETQETTIPPETVARLRLQPGVPVVITTYEGVPVTRVCLGERPRPQPLVTPPPPAPVPPPPVPALW